jgi:YidC/Oxa1 family membrane protein insertase
MDKKNTTIGVLLLLAAFASLYLAPRSTPPAPAAPQVGKPLAVSPTGSTPPAPPASAPSSPSDAAFASVVREGTDAKITTLANDFVEVRFTDFGGAIRDVALVSKDPAKKKLPGTHYVYSVTKDQPDVPYVFNLQHADPMLAFTDVAGLDRRTRYQLVSATANEVVYRAVFEDRIEVTRRYVLSPSAVGATDPYQIRHETTFRNLAAQTGALPLSALSLGTAEPLSVRDYGQYLATGHNANGTVAFTPRRSLEGGGLLSFFGIGSRAPLPFIETPGPFLWTSVDNQFFISIFTPDQPASSLTTRRVELSPLPGTLLPAMGVTGAARFDLPALAPQATAKIGGSLYVGPKEYRRLANTDAFKNDEDGVMQFGLFRFFSKLLLTLMTWIHSYVPNWGVAIILTTLTLKIVTLPLTLKASRSMKRMQKFQPEIQAIREKYKDNPQKMQTAMMELYKEHKVNPMGGCLPMLIPIPFFFGFFQMLQSTSELRFAEFLWAKDLSAPDTVLVIYGFPLNILPLLLGATMLVQMRLVPQPATVDNTQAKIMKFMPAVFMVFCYGYSCALSLYSTINGLFTIGQQLFINRLKDDEPATAKAGPGGKTMKNVTPKKKQ